MFLNLRCDGRHGVVSFKLSDERLDMEGLQKLFWAPTEPPEDVEPNTPPGYFCSIEFKSQHLLSLVEPHAEALLEYCRTLEGFPAEEALMGFLTSVVAGLKPPRIPLC
jgi:hypothetical protein